MNREFWLYAVSTLLIGATLGVSHMVDRPNPGQLAFPLDSIPSEISGWRAVNDESLGAQVLAKLAPTSYLSRTYSKGNRHCSLFVAYYAQQRAGESMHSPKHCLPGSGWEIWRYGSATVPYAGRQVEINQYSIQNAGNRMLLLYWYQSRGRIIASEYLGKLLLARDAVLTGNTAGSIVRITLPDTPAAVPEALALAHTVMPEVDRCLGR